VQDGRGAEAGLAEYVGVDEGWDVVLAGDVCYERGAADRIVLWLRALSARGDTVLLADPGRRYAPSDGLEELAVYAAPARLEIESAETQTTRVWRLTG